MSKPIFYEGQAVGCLAHGEGLVSKIGNDPFYPVYVQFEIEFEHYTMDGKYRTTSSPTLYPIDQYRAIIANLPAPQPEAWKPKSGEWCWFWDDGYTSAVLKTYVDYNEDIKFPYITATGTRYQHCAPFVGELPDHLKEVQP